jgi:hypothetical protein
MLDREQKRPLLPVGVGSDVKRAQHKESRQIHSDTLVPHTALLPVAFTW